MYRPVGLTSVICKILEKLVRAQVIKHIRENNLFSDCQHKFLIRRSCATDLLEVTDKWTESLVNSLLTDPVYLDFQKALE